jgi:hypothetical protein
MEYRIITPSTTYITDENGYVLEYSGNDLNKRGQSIESLKTWQITGIRKINAFNNLGDLIPLRDAVKLKSFQFKNRKPMYAICDIDHGTRRIHGNFKAHGCVGVY